MTAHTCCNEAPLGSRTWHRAYRIWYDADRAGSTIRAAAWGWIADRLVRWA